MRVDGRTLRLDKTLWVAYGGVEATTEGDERVLTAPADADPDAAYCKVFNHFGRLLRLLTFADGQWVDAATGAPPGPLDESLAGRVAPDQTPGTPEHTAAPAGPAAEE